MVRKSNYSKPQYFEAIGVAVQAYQEATDAFDDVAARALGLNRTDLKCLGVIFKSGSTSAGEIARATGLTKGAMTTALDRIEDAGYAKRVRDPEDRRGVRMELTKKGRDSVMNIWGYFQENGAKFLSRFDLRELEAILNFLVEGTRLQKEHRERIAGKNGL